MVPSDLVARLARHPTLDDLCALQASLLALELDPERGPAARRALVVAGEWHSFLADLESKLGARSYSQVASWMDIGAVGAAALEGLGDGESISLRQLGLAALSEGLMVMASRQYVKAWSRELQPLAQRAAWILRGELWDLSHAGQPSMSPEARQSAVTAILAPALDPATAPEARLALLARVFQLVLLAHVAGLVGAAPAHSATPAGARRA